MEIATELSGGFGIFKTLYKYSKLICKYFSNLEEHNDIDPT